MYDRTITIGSAGKTWSVTGWKIGWAMGCPELINAMQIVWQNSIYTAATPLQEACARSFKREIDAAARAGNFSGHAKDYPESYFRTLTEVELLPKRKKLERILTEFGFNPIVPDGGYFMIADCSKIRDQIPVEELDDSDDPWDYKGQTCIFYLVLDDLISCPMDVREQENCSHSKHCILWQRTQEAV